MAMGSSVSSRLVPFGDEARMWLLCAAMFVLFIDLLLSR